MTCRRRRHVHMHNVVCRFYFFSSFSAWACLVYPLDLGLLGRWQLFYCSSQFIQFYTIFLSLYFFDQFLTADCAGIWFGQSLFTNLSDYKPYLSTNYTRPLLPSCFQSDLHSISHQFQSINFTQSAESDRSFGFISTLN